MDSDSPPKEAISNRSGDGGHSLVPGDWIQQQPPVTRDPARIVHALLSSTVHDPTAIDDNEQKS